MAKGHKGRRVGCAATAGSNLSTSLIQPDQIEYVILLVRGRRVMLDRDLAALYGVRTKNLNKAVGRNADRFPADFIFQLTMDEAQTCSASRFQFGTLKRGENIKYLPYAFTQEGVAMLSSVLRSARAVQVNIAIMRVFVRLRETLALHQELAQKLDELERKIEAHDDSIGTLFEAIRELAAAPERSDREIGFHVRESSARYCVRSR
jgi:phage regulator Rha-like protein